MRVVQGRTGHDTSRDEAGPCLETITLDRHVQRKRMCEGIQSVPKSLRETSKTQPKWPKVALVQKMLKNEFA